MNSINSNLSSSVLVYFLLFLPAFTHLFTALSQEKALAQASAFFCEINPLQDLWNALRAWNTLRVWNALRRVGGFISFHIATAPLQNNTGAIFHNVHQHIISHSAQAEYFIWEKEHPWCFCTVCLSKAPCRVTQPTTPTMTAHSAEHGQRTKQSKSSETCTVILTRPTFSALRTTNTVLPGSAVLSDYWTASVRSWTATT